MAKAKTPTLGFFLSTGLAVVRGHAYVAPSCSGAACPDLAFDLPRCTAKNNGAKPIKMKIYMQDGSDSHDASARTRLEAAELCDAQKVSGGLLRAAVR